MFILPPVRVFCLQLKDFLYQGPKRPYLFPINVGFSMQPYFSLQANQAQEASVPVLYSGIPPPGDPLNVQDGILLS